MIDWADKIKKEIDSDFEYPWYKPNSDGIFVQSWMKFINRNLNYFHFPNMVALAHTGEQQLNPKFPETLKFCEFTRQFNNNLGPFGRMCIWRLPAQARLLPHVDDFEYHMHIVRNIFVISDNSEGLFKINIKKEFQQKPTKINCPKGSWFQFYPGVDWHEFSNKTDQEFYFLGYDYWIPDKLAQAVSTIGIDNLIINQDQRFNFAVEGTDKLYISQH